MTVQEFLKEALTLHSGYVSVGVDAMGKDGRPYPSIEYHVWIGDYHILATCDTPEAALVLAKSMLRAKEGIIPSPDIAIS